MKALILNGSFEGDTTGEHVRAALTAELQGRGWEIEHVLLREKKIGNCAGDFYCWVRSPGLCNVDDDNRAIAEAVVHADLLVYLTPVTFGGYSSALKHMVDHQIQNVLPFFAQVHGETHHQKRYRHYADFLAVGWLQAPDPQSEALFHNLAARNGLNFYARTAVSGIVTACQSAAELQAAAHAWLDDLQARQSTRPAQLLRNVPQAVDSALRRAVLLVGSPRTRTSSSAALGGYLFEQLAKQDVQVETFYVHTCLRSPERMAALFDAVDAADLLGLAFPLYVDSLPAPLIEALERIAARRLGHAPTHLQRLVAIANCGFPEAAHNTMALEICATFARQAGFGWAGSLSLGAGEGIVHGTPLNELDGRAIPLKKSLELAAAALLAGQPIPQEAAALMAKPIIPGWLYRAMGVYGWHAQAKHFGAEKIMKRQPYSSVPSRD
jgi:multimeric flavodoxin WrbA